VSGRYRGTKRPVVSSIDNRALAWGLGIKTGYMKILGKTIYGIFVAAVVLLAALFLGTHISLFGYEVKVVQSGSMEPAIQVGSIVIIVPETAYKVGDVITFGPDTRKQIPITHRIAEVTDGGFVTKGDANENTDPQPVAERDVIGRVAYSVPYIGHVVAFARTKLGYWLLVGLPAAAIILDEFADIVWEIRKHFAIKRYREEKRRKRMMEFLPGKQT